MVAPLTRVPDPLGRCLTGIIVRLYDDVQAGSRDISWTTYWELSWRALPGAVSYLIYYVTAEGTSTRPRSIVEPCLRFSVARGIGSLAERDEHSWRAQLAMIGVQLQIVVVPCFADGSSGLPSRRFPVGEE